MTPLRVAIVESSPLIRARVRETLADIPNLTIVGTAEVEVEARAMLRATAWDVLVIDLQLREGTGLGVLKMLADEARRENQTIIVLTHFTFPHYRKKCELLGVQHFFDKAREYRRVREALEILATGAP